MKTVANVIKIAAATLVLLFLCLVIFVWAGLAWIAFRPLPPIPQYGVQYSLQDRGLIGNQYLDVYGSDPLDWGWRLTPSGSVAHLGDAAAAADKAQRGTAVERLSRHLGIEQKPDAPYPEPSPVVSVSPRGHALIFQGDALRLWHDGQFADVFSRKVHGYSWPIYDRRFHEINAQDRVIGNGRIATAPASSGGLSSPHGRYLPLVWRPGYSAPEDLNGLIDPASGWYLDRAVDINGSGQILCIARRTDAKGAETYRQEDAHWVVLTPH